MALVLSGTDNSVSSPAVQGGTGGTSTGIYYPASNQLALATNGTQALLVDSSQNVGIGVTPSVKFQVQMPSSGNGAVFRYTGGTNNPGIFFQVNESTRVCSILTSGSNGGILALGSVSEGMRIDDSNNVGIGVTPSAWGSPLVPSIELPNGVYVSSYNGGSKSAYFGCNNYYNGTNYIYKTTGYATQYAHGSGGAHIWNIAPSGTAGNAITFTQAMTLDSSGNLLVGGTTATNSASGRGNIVINGSSTAMLNLTVGNAQKGYFYHGGTDMVIDNVANGAMLFYTNDTERARIDSSGNLLVGTTSGSGARMDIACNTSQIGQIINVSNNVIASSFKIAGTQYGYINVATTGTTYSTSSDYRLKEDIQPMTGALAKVSALKPVTYKWKSDGSDGQGFIAHELQEVVPDCVTGEKDAVDADGNPIYQGVDTSFLVATLVAAIKEQQTIITALTARIETLEKK